MSAGPHLPPGRVPARTTLLRCLLAIALVLTGARGQLPAPQPKGEESISKDDLLRHVEFLASDEMKGRDAGSEEERKAAAYIQEHMEKWGVKARGDGNGYTHGFAIPGLVCYNVCGEIVGTDSRLRREYVVLGAHYDHVGLGTSGSRGRRTGEIHNGADDNASGTSSLLELMEAFAADPPKRSLLFIFFSAEEKGLLGSKAWVKKPTLPKERIVAMLNMDMVGRSKDNYLFVGGLNTGSGFVDLIRKLNQTSGFDLELHGGGRAPSDNHSFYEADIPVMFFFTAEHAEYHTPDDDVARLNTADQERITRMIYRVTRSLADDSRRPRFAKDDRSAMPATSERGKDLVRSILGATLGPFDAESKGMPVDDVSDSTVGAKAGLRTGDVILGLDEFEAVSRNAVQSVLALKHKGERVKVRIRRGNRTLSTTLVVP